MTRFGRLLRRHPVASVLFLAGLAAVTLFAVRMAFFAVFWSDPTHRQQPPEPWMTPRYVAHSWGLDSRTVADALGIDREDVEGRPTLENIAAMRGVPIDQVIAEVQALIDEADHPTDPGR